MGTEDTLRHMLDDLSKHHRSRKQLIEYYVNTRLDKSIKSYYDELMETYHMLTRRDAAKVLRQALREEKSSNK